MQYVLTDGNGQVLKYPYNKTLLQRDNKDISFSVINDAVMARYNAFPVREVTPTITETQKIERSSMPVYQGGEWLLVHVAVDKSQAEIDAYLESLRLSARTRLKAERNTIVDKPINNVQVASISDRENIQGYLLYETEEPIKWVMADNTFQLLMKTDLQVIQNTYIMRKKLAYEAYANACRSLEVATTQAEMDAIEVAV